MVGRERADQLDLVARTRSPPRESPSASPSRKAATAFLRSPILSSCCMLPLRSTTRTRVVGRSSVVSGASNRRIGRVLAVLGDLELVALGVEDKGAVGPLHLVVDRDLREFRLVGLSHDHRRRPAGGRIGRSSKQPGRRGSAGSWLPLHDEGRERRQAGPDQRPGQADGDDGARPPPRAGSTDRQAATSAVAAITPAQPPARTPRSGPPGRPSATREDPAEQPPTAASTRATRPSLGESEPEAVIASSPIEPLATPTSKRTASATSAQLAILAVGDCRAISSESLTPPPG